MEVMEHLLRATALNLRSVLRPVRSKTDFRERSRALSYEDSTKEPNYGISKKLGLHKGFPMLCYTCGASCHHLLTLNIRPQWSEI
jgi:hypothetical protein